MLVTLPSSIPFLELKPPSLDKGKNLLIGSPSSNILQFKE